METVWLIHMLKMDCIKSIEIWQKTAALEFQLVPRDQRGWVWQGLITD